jgi:phosphoribosylglycinamide formyltransferase 1
VSAPAGSAGLRLAVLLSGEGTNLQAILDRVHGSDGIEVVAVASSRQDARGLDRARAAGVEAAVFSADEYDDRESRDRAVGDWLEARGVGLVVLAGWMQLLSAAMVARFPGRIINVHPALLPAFPGLDAIGQALRHGIRVTGVTVHFVDEGIDTGPIILQRAIELPYAASIDEVEAMVHEVEHELLPTAIRLIARGAVRIDPHNPRRVLIEEGDGGSPGT